MKIYNTLSKKKEFFKPKNKNEVKIYNCGPTVYDFDHLGHAWIYSQADFLRRTLEYQGYKIKNVLNITDVGHLTSDADSGEDKMEKSAKEKNKSVWEIAEFFTKIYLENRKKLNLMEPTVICKATDNIPEMIALTQKLLKKDFAYKTTDGIYFDIQKFKKYGRLSGNKIKNLKAGARIEINQAKKSPYDFALWKFSPAGQKRQMEWDSPWGKGFPGWHIECSAMAMKYLGETLDVHTGGEDNIFPHHEAEIAQSESATGKPFAKIWFHPRFLKIEGQKMSKSLKNFLTLKDIEDKGFSALDLRYLFLTCHYRSPLNFTWEGLSASQSALNKMKNIILAIKDDNGKISAKYKKTFLEKLNDDLNTPKALALVWKLLKDKKVSPADKKATILDFDKVLGLNLTEPAENKTEGIPEEIKNLVEKREQLRKEKNWPEADLIRKEIENRGYKVEDGPEGTKITK